MIINQINITCFYAGLFGLLLFTLSIRVISERLKNQVAIFNDNDYNLGLVIRAHGNFTEYVPMVLILMLVSELSSASNLFLHFIGSTFLISRISHAYGLLFLEQKDKKDIRGRKFGMILTFLVLMINSVYLIWKFFV